MIITNDSDLKIRLKLTDRKDEPLRVADCEQFAVKVYTSDKNRFFLFSGSDVLNFGDHDEIVISAHNLAALPSGVIAYEYTFVRDGYTKVKKDVTDFYFKNTKPIETASSDGTLNVVPMSDYQQFKDEQIEFNADAKIQLDKIENEFNDLVHKEENTVIYADKEMTQIIDGLYIAETDDDGGKIYWKDEIDNMMEDAKKYVDDADDDIRLELEAVDDRLHAVEEFDHSIFLTEHQSLEDYLTENEIKELFQEKGEYLTEHQSLDEYVKKDEMPNMDDYLSKQEAEVTYLTEHQDVSRFLTQSDIDGQYYDKEEVDAKIDAAVGIDLSPYATKSELEESISDFAKKEDIPSVEGFLKEHQSLEEYAKLTDIPQLPNFEEFAMLTDIPSVDGFLTEHQSLEGYAKLTDIPKVPSKVSELVNDSHFLTEHQNLDEYAKKNYIRFNYYDKDESDDRYVYREDMVDGFYTKSEIDSKLEDIVPYDDIYTKAEVDEKIKAATPNMDGYASKDEMKNVYTKAQVDMLVNEIDMTDIVPTLATKDELDSLEGDIRKEFDNTQLKAEIQSIGGRIEALEGVDVSIFLEKSTADKEYAKKSDIYDDTAIRKEIAMLEDEFDSIDFTKFLTKQSLNGYAKLSDIPNEYDDSELLRRISRVENINSNIVTSQEFDEYIDLAKRMFATKSDVSTDHYTKEQSDARFLISRDLNGYFSKEEALKYLHDFDHRIGELGDNMDKLVLGEVNVDLTNYYTKAQADSKFALKGEVGGGTTVVSQGTVIKDENGNIISELVIDQGKDIIDSDTISDYLKDYATKSWVLANGGGGSVDVDLSNYYTKSQADGKYQPIGNYLTEHQSLAAYAKKSDIPTDYYTKSESDGKYQPKGNYLTSHQSLSNYYTKTQSDSKYLTQHQSLEEYAKKSEVLKMVKMTQTQYDALGTKDANTLYIIC